MKSFLKYLIPIASIMMLTTLMSIAENPEKKLEGSWKESVWEYEKVDKNDTKNSDFKHISSYVKQIASQNLIIHKAEKWIFLPNQKLILKGEKTTKEISWSIKGRGNILELKYGNDNIEHYNLTELSNDKLVLNFNSDTELRGIARLTFEKNK
ncbi:hypothetical protein [Flavobacterium terrae]|uniref:Lipocalin-like domain-containing protein n=1 Tax=Flavobacterium terrae TaxID=415425 RepID=A0A1M6B4P7_9FLAO|nr:hypothetical protein [Flavobacterium terrae]SHI43734.1 hypothetical protein SAMN05444363_0558 [Flavobacterium terrae]